MSLAPKSLPDSIGARFTAADAGWLAGLVRTLVTDGLVEVMMDGEASETWRVRLG